MVTADSYTCGEHSISYGEVEPLCCTPKNNATLCQLYSIFKKEKKNIEKYDPEKTNNE